MTDEVVRLKAEVRELQETLAAERAKPVKVRTVEKRVEVPGPVRTRTVEKPDPKVVAERDRLRRRVRELENQTPEVRVDVREVEVEKRVEVPDPTTVAENERLRRRVNELTAGRSASNNKDQVARLKAEVRELQEARQARPVEPPVRTVVKPDPAVVEERDRLLQLVRTLRKQITENAKRERKLVQYLEGIKRGRND